jgi:hypothetical protein
MRSMQCTTGIIRLQISKAKMLLGGMLGGPLVTTAWRVLRLRMEATASRYGG